SAEDCTSTLAVWSNGRMADVRLVDLDVIKRFSLAVRQESAPAEDVLVALEASRVVVLEALGGRRATATAATAPGAPALPTNAKPKRRAAPARSATTRKRTGR